MTDPMSEHEFRRARRVLRTAGPLLLAAGLLCVIVAMVDFFRSMGSFGGPPTLFWLAFVGAPVLFAGLVMTKMGFAGKVARYYGREVGPAASATFNEVARDSAPGVRAVAAAVRDGVSGDRPAGSGGGARACPSCAATNDGDASFCDACGSPLARRCGSCGADADADAAFCDACGRSLAS